MPLAIRALALLIAVSTAAPAGAQPRRPFQAELLLSGVRLQAFDAETDVGAGLRVGYRIAHAFSVEAELEHDPGELGRPPFSASRTAGFLRARAGMRRSKWGLFASAGPGLVRFGKAPGPVVCIAVFPPPLECQLASGRTLLALGLGAALEVYATERILFRLDLEARLLRYPEPAFLRDGSWDGNPRLALALGVRF